MRHICGTTARDRELDDEAAAAAAKDLRSGLEATRVPGIYEGLRRAQPLNGMAGHIYRHRRTASRHSNALTGKSSQYVCACVARLA